MNCGTLLGYENHRKRNEPACRGCKSWKAKHDAGQVVEHSAKSKRAVAKCGTLSGPAVHRRNGEPNCKRCRDFRAKYEAGRSAAKRSARASKPKPVSLGKPELQPCGTVAAWLRHYRAKETICDPCADAKLIADRERSAANRKGPPPREHGTAKGRGQHKYHGEEVCEPCRIAYNTAQRKRQRVRKAKP